MNYHIYCDESRQTKDRYMVIGGIIIPEDNVAVFNQTMEKVRQEENMRAELKWSKVTNQKLSKYLCFVDYFLEQNKTDKLNFHAVIVDNHHMDYKKLGKGDREAGFYKFYYELLLQSFGRHADQDAKFFVYLDYRITNYSLKTLKESLNRGMRRRWGLYTDIIKVIEPRRAKSTNLIQMTDIVLGAIGFQKNGIDLRAGSRQAKIDLAKYIAAFVGLENLKYNTNRQNNRFTIWNFRVS